ncbi:Stp1/IreP family PP2C-type Ser/Thr phosphatase [Alkalithermobacter paradoxus]|uniref:Serine/threonine phosphatase stp n=1 Tax=Alkalithermobacter paradoxus TaxID=29349 RepID=A0A1V4IA92_9FIRM|nr:serine/threonine phosphatase stp [[Clostridium] thermoalcaliphilum]
MKHYAISDIGMVRKLNEDYYGVDSIQIDNECIYIYAVADGMGGHNKGEIASKLAIESILTYIKDKLSNINIVSDDNIFITLKSAYRSANDIIYNNSLQNEEYKGMGTTLTTCILYKNKLYIANVGDSRCYIYKNNKLTQVTKDNSLVQELIEKGIITKKDALTHPQRNVITRAIGTDERLKIDTYIEEIQENDKVILVTDGVTNYVSDDKIIQVLDTYKDSKTFCKKLVELANEKGGRDNITVLFISI